MISVVIVSVNPEYLRAVSENVANTIGCPYELIALDNAGQQKGLCERYNEGARLARYDMLCYMHEDIEIQTQNWGQMVLNILADEHIGLVGLAGSAYKPLAPSGWFCHNAPPTVNYINLVQHFKNSAREPVHNRTNVLNLNLPEVVSMDGVWFCTRKKIVTELPFDEATFKRFHCYDVDFALSLVGRYKSVVTFDILIAHFSEGGYDKTWIEETLKLYAKWKKQLPLQSMHFSEREMYIAEKNAFRFLLNLMKTCGYPWRKRVQVVANSGILSRFGPGLFLKLLMAC